MKKLILFNFIIICFSCDQDKNDIMTNLINRKRNLQDSLDYYYKLQQEAKIAVDTLTDLDLLKVDSDFFEKVSKKQIELIPIIFRLESEIKNINRSIDSLDKVQ